MPNKSEAQSPAEEASVRALNAVRDAISGGTNFKLEAGAGAGKTYSLIKALQFVIDQNAVALRQKNQKVACITFTNVAKAEIEARVERNPIVHCDTIHGFCWSVIYGFQKQLREALPMIDGWSKGVWLERLDEAEGVGRREIKYTLGYRSIEDDAIFIHHNDVLPLTIILMGNEKFRNLFRYQYPIIFIDEYQDTNAGFMTTLIDNFADIEGPPLLGFFGDHWQKIYGDGCGGLEKEGLIEIGKEANFRSVIDVVECLNNMRPELKQFVVNPDDHGDVRIFHTNDWRGTRQGGAHYGGDLPDVDANEALAKVRDTLEGAGWDFSFEKTKILMLTHRALGRQQGYESLPRVFSDNNAFTRKEQAHIEFFVDQLEPACIAFDKRRFGDMFGHLGANTAFLSSGGQKKEWSASMERLMELRSNGTVGDVVDHLRSAKLPKLSDAAERLEVRLETYEAVEGEEMPRSLKELIELHNVPYSEIVSLADYLSGHSPFETKHGVKGAQFENVLVVLGRGWNQYNFDRMLELDGRRSTLDDKERVFYERNRNLFYVACSRPQRRLALLFTQELSNEAQRTLERWFQDVGFESVF